MRTRHYVYRFVATVAVLAALAGCTQQAITPYAERYGSALDRYPGVTQTDSRSIDAFVRYFSGARAGTAGPSARELYAPTLYFSDTLLTSEDHEAIVAHLDSMHSSTGGVDVKVIDQQIDGADVYLIWRMDARFRPLRKEVVSETIGVTHLRFDANGRIVLQQDFWDSTEGFYRHLPVLGSLVGSIAGRFEEDAR